jgi:cytochrome P450
VALIAPEQQSTGPLRRFWSDMRDARGLNGPLPPGPKDFNLARTRAFSRNPLPILLECYRDHGPIFTIKILHANAVFMLGPAANHYITVSHAKNFLWREGSFRDLIPFLGDGLLTIDGEYHRRSRKVMLPAFHREALAAATQTMVDETERALATWEDDEILDVYHWTRELALRIALKALFGIDPDASAADADIAEEFEAGLGFYGRDYFLQMLRGPGTPFDRMQEAKRRIDRMIYAEIARRRSNGSQEHPDILTMLMETTDEDGWRFSDQQVRDQLMTLLFAGHDTTTSTITFLFYELARAPHELEKLLAEQDDVLGGRLPDATELATGLPLLDLAMDETLRLYPPAWIGPRRAVEAFEFEGHHVPAGAYVHYSSWASHHLPDVFPEPEAFVPERFTAENRAKLAKGAYVPFGGGSRTCIGMRFGQLEVKAIASAILQRCRLELIGGTEMSIRQMPTLSPRGGLPMIVRPRGSGALSAP